MVEDKNATATAGTEDDNFEPGKTVNKRWVVDDRLGEGCCGVVFKVHDIKNPKKKAAMKVELKEENVEVLKNEARVLRQLLDRNHVVQLIDSGKRSSYSYLVMTLFGRNLAQLKKDSGMENFTDGCVSRIGIQSLYAIKQVHEVGCIHRDVKPQNLVIGRRGRDARMVFLIDYGLSRNFVVWADDGPRIRKPRPRALLRGTTRYCSPDVHDRKEQGRKDDLWSLIYLMIELRSGLPWVRKPEPETKKLKQETTDEALLTNCPKEWFKFLQHIRELKYESRPDYKLLYDILMETMLRLAVTFADPYDWEERDPLDKEKTPVLKMKMNITEDSKSMDTASAGSNSGTSNSIFPNTVAAEFSSNDLHL